MKTFEEYMLNRNYGPFTIREISNNEVSLSVSVSNHKVRTNTQKLNKVLRDIEILNSKLYRQIKKRYPECLI